MSLVSQMKEYFVVTVAVLLSVGGIGLLFIGSYLTGFGQRGLISVVVGIALLTVGMLALLRRESDVSDRLVEFVKELFLST